MGEKEKNMNKKYVAYTFDDGPSNITERVLDILAEKNVKGTFFLVGDNITKEKEHILLRQIKEGHELANHSKTHPDMTNLSVEDINNEIEYTTKRIEEVAGVTPKFFRPPYIAVSQEMYDNIDLPFICGQGNEDWDENSTVEHRVKVTLETITPGTIILNHDGENNFANLEAIPQIIDGLLAQGYEFVTLSKLFELYDVNPNQKNMLWTRVLEE